MERHTGVSLEELRRQGLSGVQAAALVVGVAELLIPRYAAGERFALPSDSHIRISADGRVGFTRITESDATQDHVPALAALLRRLLKLDSSDRAKDVPGSVMVLMARALGEIDLPRPTLPAFRDALLRVSPDAASIRAALVSSRVSASAPLSASTAPVVAASTFPLPNFSTSPLLKRWRPAAMAFAAGALVATAATGVLDSPRAEEAPRVAVTRATVRSEAGLAPAAAAARPTSVPARAASTSAPTRAVAGQRGARLVLATVDGVEPFSPSFSADGQEMYFHAGRANGRLMRAELAPDGSVARVRPVLADGASNFHPVPSPDGTAVAFDSDREGVRAVYVADADGGNVRRVSGAGFAAVPTWSPDGGRLAFVKAGVNSRVWNVWVTDLRTGALQQVSDHRVGQAWGASWFPDGQRLAYSREDQLIIADLRHGRRTVVRSPRPGRLVRTPSVSPDGARVVFQVLGDGVWILDVTRGRISRVLTDQSAEEFRWSPGGDRIAYHSRRGGRWGVWALSES